MTHRHVETCSFSSKCWFPKAVESRSLAGAHKCLVSTSGIMECQEMSDQPSIAKLAAGACRSTSAQLFQLSSSEVSVELELELCHADIQASQLLVDLHTVSCSNCSWLGAMPQIATMLTQCSLNAHNSIQGVHLAPVALLLLSRHNKSGVFVHLPGQAKDGQSILRSTSLASHL